MPSYTVVFKFNSPINANTFQQAYPQFNPQSVNITSGFDPTLPSSDSYIQLFPANPTGTNPSFVSINVPSLDAIPFNYQPLLTFDNNNQVYVQVSPSINVSELNINTSNNTPIFQNGVPTPDYIIQSQLGPPPSSTLGFDFNPIYDNPDMRKIVPAVPPSQEQQNIELQLEIQRLLDQLLPIQTQPPVPATPQSIQQQIIQNQLMQQQLNDQLNQYFNPNPDQPPVPYVPPPFPAPQDRPQLIADYPQDPNQMRPPVDTPRQYDPFNPLDPRNLVPPETFERPPPGPDAERTAPFDPLAPYLDNPVNPPQPPSQLDLRNFPDPMEIPDTIGPWVDPYIFKNTPPKPQRPPLKVQPISDSGEGGGVPIAVGPTWFAVAGLGSSLLTQQVQIYRSVGGFKWVMTDLTGFINFVANGSLPPVSFLQFRNGFGIIVGTSSVQSSVVYRALSSADYGVTWQLVIATSPGDGKSIGTPTFSNNQWTIPVLGGTNIIIPVPWAANTFANSQDGDNVGLIPVGGQTRILVNNSGDGNTNNIQTSTDSGNNYTTTLTVFSSAGMQPWETVYQEFNTSLPI